MRRLILALPVAALLLGPTALAFFSGGYFAEPRLAAGVVACAVVVLVAVVAPVPLPRAWPGRIALLGLAALAAITYASLLWAPVSSAVLADFERLLLYLAVLTAAIALLRDERALRAAEPALAAGVLIVIGYGLSERVLPGVVDLDASMSAIGRLEQPITYWNATGGLAAIGLVLWLRIAGDVTRAIALRAAAAAAAVPVGVGLYLTFSRGALAAAIAGLALMFIFAPTRAQLRAFAAVLPPLAIAATVAGSLDGVRELAPGDRTGEGAAMLAVLVVTSALAAVAAAMLARREGDPAHAAAPLFRPRRALVIGAALGLAVIAVAVAGAAQEERRVRRPAVTGATAERLTSLESKRYGYWRVAADAFAGDPLIGIGAGGFAVEWLRERDEPDAARDAHSIYVETAAELGLLGLLALALFAGGSLVAAGRALGTGSPVAVGAAAGAATWAVHAGLDWDWEMPAVTLPAIVLVGALIATSDARRDRRESAPTRAPADTPPAPDQQTVSA